MRSVALFLAIRYLLPRSKRTFIHRLSLLSIGMVSAGALALVVGVSAFNGMETFLIQSVTRGDPDLLLRLKTQERFVYTPLLQQQLQEQPSIRAHSPVLTDHALVRHNNTEVIARVKGIQATCLAQSPWQSYVYPDNLPLDELNSDPPQAVLGIGLQQHLQFPLFQDSPIARLELIYPTQVIGFDLRKLYRTLSVVGTGVFVTQSELDETLLLIPWQQAQILFDAPNTCDALDIYLHNPALANDVIRSLAMDERYELLKPASVHKELYQLLRIEKFFVFVAFGFILAVGFFGLFFSLTMLYVSKRKDLQLLAALGAKPFTCAKIFIYQSILLALGGGTIGIGLALGICWLQGRFGWILLSSQGSYDIPYPVLVQVKDLLWVALTLLLLAVVAAIRPAIQASKLALRSIPKRNAH